MTMRITNRMMVDLGVARMNQRLTEFERSQRDLATGKRIHVASDDVAGMNRALSVRSSLAANAQAIRNAHDGMMLTDLAESRLGTVTEQLQRVRELVIHARNGTNGPVAAEAIAAEIGQLEESMLALANTRSKGRPLFAGFGSSEAVTQVGGVWTYNGDDGLVQRRISEGEMVTVNVTAGEAFGFDAGEDLFTVLDTIQSQIRSSDQAGLAASMDALDRGIDRILGARATLGAATNRIEQAIFRAQTEEVGLRTVLSQTEDTDMAEAVMELQMQEVAYQAAQGALAKTLQPSLASFLR